MDPQTQLIKDESVSILKDLDIFMEGKGDKVPKDEVQTVVDSFKQFIKANQYMVESYEARYETLKMKYDSCAKTLEALQAESQKIEEYKERIKFQADWIQELRQKLA